VVPDRRAREIHGDARDGRTDRQAWEIHAVLSRIKAATASGVTAGRSGSRSRRRRRTRRSTIRAGILGIARVVRSWTTG
jgi:hypothetical protein